MPRKGVLGGEKLWQEDAMDIVLYGRFTWHRYNVYSVLISYIFFTMRWLKLLQHKLPETVS